MSFIIIIWISRGHLYERETAQVGTLTTIVLFGNMVVAMTTTMNIHIQLFRDPLQT